MTVNAPSTAAVSARPGANVLDMACVATVMSSSWPGLSRPSTLLSLQNPGDVDARHISERSDTILRTAKPGHDGSAEFCARAHAEPCPARTLLAPSGGGASVFRPNSRCI